MAYLSSLVQFGWIDPSSTEPVGPGTLYPIGFTLSELFDYLFSGEIKIEYEFESSFTASSNVYSQTTTSALLLNPFLRVNSWSASGDTVEHVVSDIEEKRESALPSWLSIDSHCNVYGRAIGAGSLLYRSLTKSLIDGVTPVVSMDGEGSRPVAMESVASITIRCSAARPVIYKDGLYYIYQLFSFFCIYNGFYCRLLSNNNNRELPLAGDLNFIDKSIPIYLTEEPPYGLDYLRFEGSVSRGPYWPYDPGDTASYPGKDGSGPVVDMSTGAFLRNPSNIRKRGDGTFYNPNYVAP